MINIMGVALVFIFIFIFIFYFVSAAPLYAVRSSRVSGAAVYQAVGAPSFLAGWVSGMTVNQAAVAPSFWAADEIALARGAGLITDSATRDFRAAITRVQFCELLIKLYENLEKYAGNPGFASGLNGTRSTGTGAVFKDTDDPAVIKAFELGLVNGVSADEFAPHQKITRQEICAMLVRCIDKAIPDADISYYKINSFTDNESIAGWAKPFVNYAYDHKIISGVAQGTIAPLDNVTCEQAILLTYRASLGNYADKSAPFAFVDGHADTITAAMGKEQSLYENNLHVDFSRLNKFDSPVQVFTIWCADRYVDNAYEYANSAIDFFEAELAAHSGIIEIALTFEDLERNAKNGKISAILALEGAEPLAGKLGNIDHFYNRGVRLITLTWNRENELGYGVGATAGAGKGLKPFGVECIKRMDELGIIIDVSHLNEAGFWDVDRLSSRPYMASHSNVYSVTRHDRNLKDDQIKAIIKKGGIIGLNLYPYFLEQSGNADISSIMKHIDSFIALGAEENLGLGCDFDGISALPKGLTDVSSLKTLEQEIASHFGKRISSRIMSDNYYEFFKRFFQ